MKARVLFLIALLAIATPLFISPAKALPVPILIVSPNPVILGNATTFSISYTGSVTITNVTYITYDPDYNETFVSGNGTTEHVYTAVGASVVSAIVGLQDGSYYYPDDVYVSVVLYEDYSNLFTIFVSPTVVIPNWAVVITPTYDVPIDLVNITYFYDGVNNATFTNTYPTIWLYTVDGVYTVYAIATDINGNSYHSNNVTVTVSSSPSTFTVHLLPIPNVLTNGTGITWLSLQTNATGSVILDNVTVNWGDDSTTQTFYDVNPSVFNVPHTYTSSINRTFFISIIPYWNNTLVTSDSAGVFVSMTSTENQTYCTGGGMP